MPTGKLTYEVLLVEDNFSDVALTRLMLKDLSASTRLTVATDGEEALQILRSADYRPSLVILDLRMPKKSGVEVLAEMRSDSELECLPVIIFSSSSDPAEIAQCYKLGANAYVLKPLTIRELQRVWSAIQGFWMGIALLPQRARVLAP
jgi:two-component system response regulator